MNFLHLDYTVSAYSRLLQNLAGYTSSSFDRFLHSDNNINVVLRHDVDQLPENSLHFAQIQNQAGIQGTYYFRIVPESFQPAIIEQIARLGHEIGYHYEDLTLVAKTRQKAKGKRKKEKRRKKDDDAELVDLLEQGIESFAKNLEMMRIYSDIKTICMHGSPLSKWDSRLLWTRYDYRDFGIIGEPYFDIDFSQVAYYTDTGRRWDGDSVSVRDKVVQDGNKFPKFHSTFDIIRAAESGKLPNQVMFTFHPQRWHDRLWPWTRELLVQNAKNVVKYGMNVWQAKVYKDGAAADFSRLERTVS